MLHFTTILLLKLLFFSEVFSKKITKEKQTIKTYDFKSHTFLFYYDSSSQQLGGGKKVTSTGSIQ